VVMVGLGCLVAGDAAFEAWCSVSSPFGWMRCGARTGKIDISSGIFHIMYELCVQHSIALAACMHRCIININSGTIGTYTFGRKIKHPRVA
jgi:hypothetical protein